MATKLHIPICFKQGGDIFLEYPTIPNGPQGYVLRFPDTAEGAWKMAKHIVDLTPKGGHVPSADRVLAVHQSAKVRRGKKHEPKYGEREARAALDKFGLKEKA